MMAHSGHLSAMPPEAFAAAWACHAIPTARIAERLGVSTSGLRWRANKLGLTPRPHSGVRRRLVPDEVFRRLWEAGVSRTEIASACGYSHPSGASRRASLMGLPRRPRGGHGGHSGWPPTITMAEFRELELRRMMDEVSA